MASISEIAVLLRELGLTETEAEVYVALLQASRGEAVSGYKVAKDMGRDPANLAKTLAALGRRGAVRVVQEKPRLFLPVAPSEFTGHILEKMADTQQRTVEMLRQYEVAPAAGTALALAGPDQVLERARLMLGNCRSEALLFVSPEVCDRLRPLLENLAEAEIPLRIVSTRTIAIAGAVSISLPLPAGIRDPEATPWLQLAVDREVWLIAQPRNEGTPQAPSGWWGEDPGLAVVLAAGLEAMTDQGASTAPEPHRETEAAVDPEPETEPAEIIEPEPEPVVEIEPVFEAEPVSVADPTPEAILETEPDPIPEPTPEPEPESIPEPSPDPEPQPEPKPQPRLAPNPEPEADDDLEFIIRHDEDA